MKIVSRPIDMVAWFTKDGELNPVRFRCAEESEEISVIKIDRIICKDTEKYGGNNMIVYRCTSKIKGIQKIYEIKYEIGTCKWSLYKI